VVRNGAEEALNDWASYYAAVVAADAVAEDRSVVLDDDHRDEDVAGDSYRAAYAVAALVPVPNKVPYQCLGPFS
jgi:hypothetical protein